MIQIEKDKTLFKCDCKLVIYTSMNREQNRIKERKDDLEQSKEIAMKLSRFF